MSVKIVDNIDEAIEHIYKYGTGHSECIVTENDEAANEFMSRVDAAAVYRNASTRFTDGGEFGFGAEIGISTQSSTREALSVCRSSRRLSTKFSETAR